MFIQWLRESAAAIGSFLASDAFLVPFLATLVASLTVIYLQNYQRKVSLINSKLFGVVYIADVTFRILKSEFILRKHTLVPHIEATKRMIEGDIEILKRCFESDDFDVLTDPMMDYQLLPNDRKILIGMDEIDLVQAFEGIVHMYRDDSTNKKINDFVKKNLKNPNAVFEDTPDKRAHVLSEYLDCLFRADHHKCRIIWFGVYIILPAIEGYLKNNQFLFYSRKNAKKKTAQIKMLIGEYADFLPPSDYMQKIAAQGIQQVVADDVT